MGVEIGKERLVVSVVSHRQGDLVRQFLHSIQDHVSLAGVLVVVTINVPEEFDVDGMGLKVPVVLIRNEAPKGFGENHNYAFSQYPAKYFCVSNPDVELVADPFDGLINLLESNASCGVAAPVICSESGEVEDSARQFPTALELVKRLFFRQTQATINRNPDWVAGMFMLFRYEVFNELNGFDQRYFMYCEDIDICARVRLSGRVVMVCDKVRVVHNARRDSRKKPLYLYWHIKSMLRFFLTTKRFL